MHHLLFLGTTQKASQLEGIERFNRQVVASAAHAVAAVIEPTTPIPNMHWRNYRLQTASHGHNKHDEMTSHQAFACTRKCACAITISWLVVLLRPADRPAGAPPEQVGGILAAGLVHLFTPIAQHRPDQLPHILNHKFISSDVLSSK